MLDADDIDAIAEAVRRILREEGYGRHESKDRKCGFCGSLREEVDQFITGISGRDIICDGCVLGAIPRVARRPRGVGIHPVELPSEVASGRFIRSEDAGRHGGLVYAVATVPDLDIRRLKIGFTARSISSRLENFRTVNPTAHLLGLWPAPLAGEGVALGAVDGRLRGTEVFHVADVVSALMSIDAALMERWPWST